MSAATAAPAPMDRNLYLATQVDQSSINHITRSILDIERSDAVLAAYYKGQGMEYVPRPITLYIDSYGGECYACFGLLSVMDLCSTPIRTVVTGCAMSCGFLIAIHGHERVAYPNATMMFHQVSSFFEGKAADLFQDAAEVKRLQEKLERATLRRTKITKEQLRRNYETKTDWFMAPPEALRLGVIDSIAKRNIF